MQPFGPNLRFEFIFLSNLNNWSNRGGWQGVSISGDLSIGEHVATAQFTKSGTHETAAATVSSQCAFAAGTDCFSKL